MIFVTLVSVSASSVCIFVDGPTPHWLGSNNGCEPYVTYEIQKHFGIFWHE